MEVEAECHRCNLFVAINIDDEVQAAVAAEREACAALAEEWATYYPTSMWPEIDMREEIKAGMPREMVKRAERNAAGMARQSAKCIAENIRQRGEQGEKITEIACTEKDVFGEYGE
jgi:hypothetical protein